MRYTFVLFLVISSTPFTYSQSGDSFHFESQYSETASFIDHTVDSLEIYIALMEDNINLTEVQKAQINFIKRKIYNLCEIDPLFYETTGVSTDSIEQLPLFIKAENYIVQSRPDEGIPLIFEFLQTVDEDSDSAVYAKIYLAEAYREKQEFRKGMEIIYGLLENKSINLKNKAFAYNRIAALYNECGNWIKNRSDSVVKYSNLCINISTENDFIGYLAASQNELAYIYRQRGLDRLSIDYGLKAYDNFLSIKKIPQAMNTAINLAKTHKARGELQKAEQVLNDALKLGTIKRDKNLYMRTYLLLAWLNAERENYRDAYKYLKIARSMQSSFYRERINLQINEMSAKYETERKEKKIVLLKKDNEIQELQLSRKNEIILSLFIGVFIFIILSGFIFVLYRKRNTAYKRLVDKNLDLIHCENKPPLVSKTLNNSSHTLDEDSKLKHLAFEFDKYLKKEKPFLFSEISYDEVCKRLNTNRTYLSKAINKSYNKSFLEVINYFRIKEASLYLSDPKYNHISIEGIGQMTGFNYKAAFYSNFKKQVGITPSFFRKNAQK